jgi:hypothetical protein
MSVLLSLVASIALSAGAAEMTRDQKLEWFMAQPQNRAILASNVSDEEKTRLVLELPMNRRTLGSDLETYAPALIAGYSTQPEVKTAPRVPGKNLKRRAIRSSGGTRVTGAAGSGKGPLAVKAESAGASSAAGEAPAGGAIEGGGQALGGNGLARGSGPMSLPSSSLALPSRGGGPISAGAAAAGGPIEKDPKAAEKEAAPYSGLMARVPYIGTANAICRYGPTTGRCTHEGKFLPPPPGPPSSFEVRNIGLMPYYPNTNHTAFPLLNHKWALKFVARPSQPFPVHLDSPNGFVARSAMEIFMAISEKPGDFDVAPECLVLPDMLSNGWAGGAAHSVARIEVSVGKTSEQRCALTPGRTYYVNIAGDCSDYYSSGTELSSARAAGCMTDLVEVNGWIRLLTPGGPSEWCSARGKTLGPDGMNCLGL